MNRRPLKDDVRSQEYHRVAYQCLELAHTKGGCNNNCAACPLNVHMYIDDPREATLIKTSAAIDYHKQQEISASLRAYRLGTGIAQAFMFVLYVALFIVMVVWPISCTVKAVKSIIPKEGVFESTPPMSYIATDEVERKITMVSQATIHLGDITGDGQYDCIDDALGFYELYGGECQILWLAVGQWSHLFVAVPNGYGQWLYIETRYHSSSLSKILLQNNWSANIMAHIGEAKNVTMYYKDIRAGTHRWKW